MNRRAILQLAAATLVLPGWARAQAQKVYRLGWLAATDEATTKPLLEGAFLAGMRELGYAAGRNLVVDVRYAQGDAGRFPALAAELIALKPDVLLGIESACRALAARTEVIPIVILTSNDPVAAGLVKSLARPGTNVTGLSNLLLTAKHVELLTEIVPKLSRVVLLNDATNTSRDSFDRVAREASAAKKLKLLSLSVTPSQEEIRAAFAQLGNLQGSGMVLANSGPFYGLRNFIASEAARMRLPAVYPFPAYVEAGGLISYGANLAESYRREVPPIVDRILRGANPADIPVQQATKFEMVVNLKAASQLGLTVPQTVLFRANRVIE